MLGNVIPNRFVVFLAVCRSFKCIGVICILSEGTQNQSLLTYVHVR